MPRAALLAAALTVAAPVSLAVAVKPALAKCAAPRVVFAPPDGAAVPAQPVLHVFVPGAADPSAVTVLADGALTASRVEVVTRGTDADVTALRIFVAKGSYRRLTVRVDGKEAEATYRVDPGWRAPSRGAVKLSRVTREKTRWTCSHTDAFALEVESGAIAYQVVWATSADPMRHGSAASLQVLPRDRDDFWGSSRPGRATTIGLGHLSCLGETIPERALGGPLYVRVTGLFADGSTTEPWAGPVLLTEPEPEPEPDAEPELVCGNDTHAHAPALDHALDHDHDHDHEHEHEHQPALPADWRHGLALAAVLPIAAALLALLLRARRRRTTRVASPPR